MVKALRDLRSECIKAAAMLVRIPGEDVASSRELVDRETVVKIAILLRDASDAARTDSSDAGGDEASLLSALAEANTKVRHLEEALRDAERDLSDSAFQAHVERRDPWGSK